MTTIESLYRAHCDEVHRFAYWLSGDTSEAEDIVSETFLRVWGSVDELRVATMKAYLLTVARNVFISRRRRGARDRQLTNDLPDEHASPQLRAERSDELRSALLEIGRLPEGERTALLLRIQHDLSYEEIARSLQISLSAAKVRVHRARLKLAESRAIKGVLS